MRNKVPILRNKVKIVAYKCIIARKKVRIASFYGDFINRNSDFITRNCEFIERNSEIKITFLLFVLFSGINRLHSFTLVIINVILEDVMVIIKHFCQMYFGSWGKDIEWERKANIYFLFFIFPDVQASFLWKKCGVFYFYFAHVNRYRALII